MEFVCILSNRKTSETRNIKKYSCEPDEITIVHELIKEKLIKDIEDNPSIIDINDPIDIKSIYRENLVNGNNFIDLVAKTKDEKIIFFEIKTSQDPRLCIRQVLGQLMEYAYYPNVKHADKLVIVGPFPGNGDKKKYIKKINQDFNLDLQYLPCTNFLK